MKMWTLENTTSSASACADLGRRAGARAVDAAILAGLGLAAGVVIGYGIGWFAVEFTLVAVYLLGLDTTTGATAGKALFGLHVVAGDGMARRPTLAEAARHEAFVVLGAIPFVGPILGPVAWSVIAWSIRRSPSGEGIHDRFAGTRVVPVAAATS
jgi:uncharacterized RDD family membrane protein YckC